MSSKKSNFSSRELTKKLKNGESNAKANGRPRGALWKPTRSVLSGIMHRTLVLYRLVCVLAFGRRTAHVFWGYKLQGEDGSPVANGEWNSRERQKR